MKKTDFGYEKVDWNEKQSKVNDVFHSVANKYDLMNDVMSLGIHRLWKRHTIQKAQVRSGHYILDLAGGTGDLSYAFSQKVGPDGQVILSDINQNMLEVGRTRLIDRGILQQIQYVQANAEYIPFPTSHFDRISISFGLRNVRDKSAALKEMYRTLKPGGKCLILEFSKPLLPILEKMYDHYSFKVIPFLGKIITQDADSYRYLAESIRMHPDQETLKQQMIESSFEDVTYENLTGGVVALHIGHKY